MPTQQRNDVAVVLNANAKKVTPRLKARLERDAAGVDIFYSTSLEEGERIAKHILEAGYPTVLTGGGDGTFIQMVNTLYRLSGRLDPQQDGVISLAERRGHGRMPNVGILRLGTGNAVANVVGAGSPLKDIHQLRRIHASGRTVGAREIGLIESEGSVFPFAGLGWDGAVLNDYVALKDACAESPMESIVKSAAGYIIAAALRTAPRLLTEGRPTVKITALDEGYLLDQEGRPSGHFAEGDVLYEGPAGMVTFGSVQYIGAKLKLFPQATRTDHFQLRAVNMNPIEGFMNLPRAWVGKMNSPKVKDFLVKSVQITCDRPMPYQVGGDAMGFRDDLILGTTAAPLSTVDYRRCRHASGMLPSARPLLKAAGDE